MTQLESLRAIVDGVDKDFLIVCLDLAGSAIVNRCYPFDSEKPVPPKYYARQVEIAAYLVNKQGAEGEISHNENGISRSYESASIPESMLKDITPFAKVLGGGDE